MSCRFDKEIIQKYIDNTIEPLERIFLKEHLQYCEECRGDFNILMTAENELDKFFNKGIELKDIDFMIENIVDNCIGDEQGGILSHSIRIGKRIAENSSKFVNFLPGSKYVKKRVNLAATKSISIISTILRKQLDKLLPSD